MAGKHGRQIKEQRTREIHFLISLPDTTMRQVKREFLDDQHAAFDKGTGFLGARRRTRLPMGLSMLTPAHERLKTGTELLPQQGFQEIIRHAQSHLLDLGDLSLQCVTEIVVGCDHEPFLGAGLQCRLGQ